MGEGKRGREGVRVVGREGLWGRVGGRKGGRVRGGGR